MLSEPLVVERMWGATQAQGVLRLRGPLTTENLAQFQGAIRREQAATMILDFAEVPYVDSAGLGSLVSAYISCQKAGRRMALSGVNQRVLKLFEITKVEQIFLIFPDLLDATEAMANSGSA
ncbi:MAG TPA: STAS domain-containing protein [Terriglobales bacterium]|jgi:anti-sigma B factor antagonist